MRKNNDKELRGGSTNNHQSELSFGIFRDGFTAQNPVFSSSWVSFNLDLWRSRGFNFLAQWNQDNPKFLAPSCLVLICKSNSVFHLPFFQTPNSRDQSSQKEIKFHSYQVGDPLCNIRWRSWTTSDIIGLNSGSD